MVARSLRFRRVNLASLGCLHSLLSYNFRAYLISERGPISRELLAASVGGNFEQARGAKQVISLLSFLGSSDENHRRLFSHRLRFRPFLSVHFRARG